MYALAEEMLLITLFFFLSIKICQWSAYALYRKVCFKWGLFCNRWVIKPSVPAATKSANISRWSAHSVWGDSGPRRISDVTWGPIPGRGRSHATFAAGGLLWSTVCCGTERSTSRSTPRCMLAPAETRRILLHSHPASLYVTSNNRLSTRRTAMETPDFKTESLYRLSLRS